MARFSEQSNIRQVSTETGFVQASNSLLSRLEQFSSSAESLARQSTARKGIEEAQQVSLEKEGGITHAPKKKEKGFKERFIIGGVGVDSYNKTLETAYLASLGNDTKEAINAIEAENPSDTIAFNEKAQGYVNGLLKSVDPSVRQQVAQFAESQVSNSRMRVHRKGILKNKADAIAESRVAVTSFGDEAARLSREGNQVGAAEQMLNAFETIDGMVEAGDLSKDEAVNLKRGIERESTEQKIRKDFDDLLNDEGAEAAFKKLDDMANNPSKGFTPDEWDTFIASEQADLNQAITRAAKIASQATIEQSREVSNLKIQASNGLGDAEKIIQRTDKLFSEGKISESERTSIFTNVINGQKKERKQAVDFAAVANKLSGDNSIVLDDKLVDDYYERNVQQNLQGATTQEAFEAKAFYVNRTKQVPAALKQEISTFLQSGDPELISYASRLIDVIDSSPGILEREFSASDRAFAQQVNELSQNLSPEEAVKLARQLTDPSDTARVDAIEQVIKSEKLRETYRYAVEDHFNTLFDDKVDDVNGNQLTKEYESLFEANFKAGMTEKAAKEKAFQMISRNWKVSEVTGKVMKYPPDQYYQVGGDVSYIKKQLIKDVNEQLGSEFEPDNVFLQATEETARTATTGQPNYRVVVVTDEGLQPLYGFKWKPDQAAETERKTKLNQKQLIDERKQAIKSTEATSRAVERLQQLRIN